MKKVEVTISDAHLVRKKIELSAPKTSIVLTKGLVQKNIDQPIAFTTGVPLNWKEVKFETGESDTTGLVIEKISGHFNDPTFSFSPKTKLKWGIVNVKRQFNGRSSYF
jgi:hypothetical protein